MTDAIAERFRIAVSLRLVSNFRVDVKPGTPLILGIQGPPGEGKTYQVEQILKEADIVSILLSGGELESPNAGAPAARVRAAYLEASAYIGAQRPATILLNDADAAIGSWGDMTQYTVNTQNLITELMHLADYPTRVEGKQVHRVPIIMTGNDFTRLYAPLRRSGRMRIFSWRMETAERAAAVRSLFPWPTNRQATELVHAFPDQAISFWATVRRRMDDEVVTATLRKYALYELARKLTAGHKVNIFDRAYSVDEIVASAEVIAAETAHNFLSS